MKEKLYFIILIILLLDCKSNKDIIIMLDNEIINGNHVRYAVLIEDAYGDTNQDTVSILCKLIQQRLHEVIAKNEGIIVTDRMLASESDRFDKETKSPDILNRVSNIFGKKRQDYLEYFVKPVLIERLLQEKFFSDTLYHKNVYNKLKDAYAKLEKDLIITDSTIRIFEPSEESYSHYKNAIGKNICEDKYTYFFVKVKWGKITVYSVKKNDFTEWFWGEALKIRVDIHDNELRKRLLMRTDGSDFWHNLLIND